MNFSVNINNSFLYWIFLILSVNKSWSKSLDGTCGDRQLLPPKGTIMSPSYPALHSHEVSCTWHILSPPQSTLKIRIKDFDVPDDPGCDEAPCCYYNWVSLPVTDKPGLYHQYCGNINQTTISVSQIHTVIRFHYYSPPDFYHARGFHLTYSIEKRTECEDGQFSCKDGTCLQKFMKCDGTIQCADGDDEMHCTGFSKCGKDELLCSTSSQRCFTQSELCDGVFQCPFGEDEFACAPGCERGIACLRGEGCYLPSQRCDGRSDCIDDSDESFCPDELCPKLPNKRQCRNGRCIQSRLWCDGSDDCGDFSDEEACLKNSMITIAMMGALLGGLFLVLAVGCSLRIYSRRCSDSHNCQMHHSHPGARHRMTHSLSLPALIDNEFFHREPPPMYSVAVGNTGLPRRTRPSRSRSSSSRRHHSHRHTVAVVVPKPPSENALNNSSSPSSEDSLIASSNTPNVNSDDNEQLLTA